MHMEKLSPSCDPCHVEGLAGVVTLRFMMETQAQQMHLAISASTRLGAEWIQAQNWIKSSPRKQQVSHLEQYPHQHGSHPSQQRHQCCQGPGIHDQRK